MLCGAALAKPLKQSRLILSGAQIDSAVLLLLKFCI
jgi:hypothetical protein